MRKENIKKSKTVLILEGFADELREIGEQVGDLEYTDNNYSNSGLLITEKIPTITTSYCEIGLFDSSVYFVYIIEARHFSKKLFTLAKDAPGVSIYGFKNFLKNLYPNENFNYGDFLKEIAKDKYLQIQFDIKSINLVKLLAGYIAMKSIFKECGVLPVDQLKNDLRLQP